MKNWKCAEAISLLLLMTICSILSNTEHYVMTIALVFCWIVNFTIDTTITEIPVLKFKEIAISRILKLISSCMCFIAWLIDFL